MESFDIIVIGGGPAGLAAAIRAAEEGASVCVLEREAAPGGILKQCIHDGFGLVRYGEKLAGPEYAARFIRRAEELGIRLLCQSFVTKITQTGDGFDLTLVRESGLLHLGARALILATGCRERTPRQVGIHGTRPAGVFTAGCAQHYVNLLGQKIGERCVILGSGDIGLIMARRLTLEGTKVLGVYEIMPEPSGLGRNIRQCLEDFGIPLRLSMTVTRIFGDDRVEGVEVARVDEARRPIPGTEERIDCDALIVSVGLIPENELAAELGIEADPKTGGPALDLNYMTKLPGVFACGNCFHVYDLVDSVSESGEAAGSAAAAYVKGCLPQAGPQEVKPPVRHPLSPGAISCIVCPNSCELFVCELSKEADSLKGEDNDSKGEAADSRRFEVTGNRCRRGRDYAIAEMTKPMRSLTTSVRTVFASRPMLPVRTAGEVPKARIPELMSLINEYTLTRPVRVGEVLIPDILGLSVDIIATADCPGPLSLKEENA